MLDSRYAQAIGRQSVTDLQLLFYGLGWFCLGAGLSVGLMFILAGLKSETQDGQGCLGSLIALIGILFAVVFFILAFNK